MNSEDMPTRTWKLAFLGVEVGERGAVEEGTENPAIQPVRMGC